MSDALLILFLFVSIILFIRQKEDFLYTLLPLNFILDILTAYYDRGGFFTILRFIILIGFIGWFYLRYRSKTPIEKTIILWTSLQILLLPMSSNVFYSFNVFLKTNLTLYLFLIAHRLGFEKVKFYKIGNGTVLILVLFIVNTIINTYFGIGVVVYGKDDSGYDFSTGSVYGSTLTVISYCLLIIPVIKNHINLKGIYLSIMGVISVIFLALSMRRTTIILLVAGFLIYLFILNRYFTKTFFYIILMILIIIGSFPYYQDTLLKGIEARSSRFEEGALENEARWLETIAVYSDILSFRDVKYSLLGKEIWNSPGNYGDIKIFGDRQIHVDYTNIINGMGIIGLAVYLLIFIQMLYCFIRYYIRIKHKTKELRFIAACFIVFLVTISLNSLSGQMYAITHRAFALVTLGLILGYIKKCSLNSSPTHDKRETKKIIYSNVFEDKK